VLAANKQNTALFRQQSKSNISTTEIILFLTRARITLLAAAQNDYDLRLARSQRSAE
jgi:hypothetical protein